MGLVPPTGLFVFLEHATGTRSPQWVKFHPEPRAAPHPIISSGMGCTQQLSQGSSVPAVPAHRGEPAASKAVPGDSPHVVTSPRRASCGGDLAVPWQRPCSGVAHCAQGLLVQVTSPRDLFGRTMGTLPQGNWGVGMLK